ncbi:MAG: hypothetical protein GWP06_11055 [Actinobacteria bacterium]|nr:hypothetical protein [Actinomycetota bacterium]
MLSGHKEQNFDKKYGKALHKIKTTITASCPDAEILLQYYRNELAPEHRKKNQQHVDVCPHCLLALSHLEHADKTDEKLPQNWQMFEQEMDTAVYSYLDSKAAGREKSFLKSNWLERFLAGIRRSLANLMPKPAAIGLAAVVIIGTIYSYAYISRPDYFDMAKFKVKPLAAMRSAAIADNELQKGLHSFDRGNYSAAIRQLSSFILHSPDSYVANHYLGIAYLIDAKKSLPGLTYNYDDKKVNHGKQYLQKALALSGNNYFYQEDNYWYLAKAALMQEDLTEAKIYLHKMLELDHPGLMRKDEAQSLLNKIE